MELEIIKKKDVKDSDISDICKVFNYVYKDRPFQEDYIKWRFFDTPFNKNYNLIAYDQGIPVGHAALCPRELFVNGDIGWAAQSLGSVISPGFQKAGLYTKMAEIIYDKAMEDGVGFIWGFPNNNSHYGRKTKLNWEDIYEIPTKQLMLNKARLKGQKLQADVFNVSIDCLDPGETLEKFSKIYFLRTKKYFEWRYVKNPRHEYFCYTIKGKYELKTYLIYKIYETQTGKFVDIVDFEAFSLEDFSQMLLKLIFELLEKGGFSGVNLWLNTNHEFSPITEKFGFINITPITFFACYSPCLAGGSFKGCAGLSDYKKWFITMGDSDLF